jgi:hypothetical protein
VDRNQIAPLKGNVNPRIKPQFDVGPVDPSMKLNRVMLMLKRSDAQQAALDQLLAEQQTPSSANYHKWLTPERFGDQFGISSNDIAQVSSWLQAEGLTVEEVSRSRSWIWFSGTADQVQTALRTTIRRYSVNGESHFANAVEPSVPAAIEPLVAGILGLDDFQPKPPGNNLQPLFTAANGGHSLVPDDFATIYDLVPLYNAGFDGSGQSIVVIGRSHVALTDIQMFRTFFNLPKNDPEFVLVPGSLDPGTTVTEDQREADLDIEWAGAVARNAHIIYVYSTNIVTLSVPYAINQNLAPIITYSFSLCEQNEPPSLQSSIRALAQQANAQGITWLAASGDSGAAGCDSDASSITSGGLAVGFPASLPEVTGVGGTQFNAGGAYWSSSNSPNYASALSYVPEQGWNQGIINGFFGLDSSGGGVSTMYAQPVWQAGPGVPSGGGRAVPDVSLSADFSVVPYNTIVQGQFQAGGGTSAATPSFAGILALVNQYQVANGLQTQSGQGNINPNLYSLAQTSPNIFHDITTGNNVVPCTVGTPDCSSSGTLGYSAGPGYDLVTGLGSVDGFNLAGGLAAQWSIPVITSLTPNSVVAGGGDFTLSVLGSGFDSGTVAQWNGASLPTTFASATHLLASVSASLVASSGSASVTVLNAQGSSTPSPVAIAASSGATFNSARVTTTAPPAGCSLPPVVNSFAVTDTVYLYFSGTITTSDLLYQDWLAPDGTVVAGFHFTYLVNSGTFCFTNGSSLPLAGLPFKNLGGTWQARVFDNGNLLLSVPFTVNIPTASQAIDYYFSQLSFAGEWQMTLTYINYSAQSVTCTTNFYSDTGTPLLVPFSQGTISTRVDTLLPGHSIHDQTVSNLAAPVSEGWAHASCTGPVQASLLYRLFTPPSFAATGEAAVNAEASPATNFVTFAETQTGVAYGNPSTTQTAAVTFTVFSSAGTLLASKMVSLGPGAHSAFNVGPYLGLGSFTGWIEVTSTIPIISLSLNAEAFPSFSSMPPGDLSTTPVSGSQDYYFPQLTFAGEYQMTLTYINYSSQSVTCTTNFYSDAGTPLLVPFSQGTISTRVDTLLAGHSIHDQTIANLAAPVSEGWAHASCTGPVQASLLYRLFTPPSFAATGEAAVNAEKTPTTKFVTFAEVQTGIAYGNPSTTQTAAVTFTLFDSTGVEQAAKTVQLGPGAHSAFNVGTAFGPGAVDGFVKIIPTIPIISLSLNAEAFPSFSSMPPGDLPASTIVY